ncbi:MAG: hypothetical protein KDJ50_04465 [Alphaproteobacteria bacterium]|nr:hypothetical protein [Alphaproteobacteria bacterium]
MKINSFPTIKAVATFLLISAGSIFCSISSNAEVVEIEKERLFGFPSTDEDVGLSFLKMAGLETPEFDKIIVRTEKYKALMPFEKQAFLKEEVPRLYNKYMALDPKREGLLIRVSVKLFFANANGAAPAKLQVFFPAEGMIYFPYMYAGIPIAVIPNGIENFTEIILTEEEATIAMSTMDQTPEATLVLDLKPISADAKKPMILDGEKQFPLLCEIGYIGLHNSGTDQIWAWGTQGNMTEGRKDPLIEILKPQTMGSF